MEGRTNLLESAIKTLNENIFTKNSQWIDEWIEGVKIAWSSLRNIFDIKEKTQIQNTFLDELSLIIPHAQKKSDELKLQLLHTELTQEVKSQKIFDTLNFQQKSLPDIETKIQTKLPDWMKSKPQINLIRYLEMQEKKLSESKESTDTEEIKIASKPDALFRLYVDLLKSYSELKQESSGIGFLELFTNKAPYILSDSSWDLNTLDEYEYQELKGLNILHLIFYLYVLKNAARCQKTTVNDIINYIKRYKGQEIEKKTRTCLVNLISGCLRKDRLLFRIFDVKDDEIKRETEIHLSAHFYTMEKGLDRKIDLGKVFYSILVLLECIEKSFDSDFVSLYKRCVAVHFEVKKLEKLEESKNTNPFIATSIPFTEEMSQLMATLPVNEINETLSFIYTQEGMRRNTLFLPEPPRKKSKPNENPSHDQPGLK